jgi:hypothetical protein
MPRKRDYRPHGTMLACECGQEFVHRKALRQHRRAAHSCKCPNCSRKYTASEGPKQHVLTTHQWQCGQCNERLLTLKSLNRHRKLTGHCYCHTCNKLFESPDALKRHENASDHVNQFHCCECDRDFVTGAALEQHLKDKNHTVIHRRKEECICEKCNRTFSNNSALKQHQNSLAHRPISNLKCVDAQCDKRFKCPSSLLHHLGSGACPSRMDRDQLNTLIYTYDTDQMISDQNHIGAFDDAPSEIPEINSATHAVYTPSSTSSDMTLSMSRMVLSNDFNIQQEEQVSTAGIPCRECSKTFTSVHSLEQHRHSAAHTSAIFRCPMTLLGEKHVFGSVRYFTTISGLA